MRRNNLEELATVASNQELLSNEKPTFGVIYVII